MEQQGSEESNLTPARVDTEFYRQLVKAGFRTHHTAHGIAWMRPPVELPPPPKPGD